MVDRLIQGIARRIRPIVAAELIGLFVIAGLVTWGGGGTSAGSPPVVHAAPIHSLQSVFVPLAPAGVTVAIPATTAVIGCEESSGPAVGYASGCVLLLDIPVGDPTVSRTFRAQGPQPYPNSISVYDAAVEHPVAHHFQRSGTGYTTQYIILESN